MSVPAWFLVVCSLQGGAGDTDALERALARLDAAEEAQWDATLAELAARGLPAGLRALEDFEACAFTARRARAKLLLVVPAPELAAPVLARLDDPDPQVRRLLLLLLGNPALGEVAAEARVAAFERLARADPADYVRQRARESLAESGLVAAVPALDRLIDALPPREAERAAVALARLPAARERLIARVQRGAGASAPGVFSALLSGYGRALAEVPGGGESPLERRALLEGRLHAAGEVRAAAQLAVASFTARCGELGEAGRAQQVLARLADEGWPRLECVRRRLDVAWLLQGDPAAGLELARELEHLARVAPGDGPGGEEEREGWLVRARLFAGAALYALGREPEAAQVFTPLAAELEASLARRLDLFPSPRQAEWTRGGGAAFIERLHYLALVEQWQALLSLSDPAHERATLEHLARAHELFLRSREVAVRTDATDPTALDALFARELGPHALVLFNERLDPARRGTMLSRAVELARAWAGVAPLEMVGFEPSALGRAFDPLLDERRLVALRALRAAHVADLGRRQRELQDPELAPRDPGEVDDLARILAYRRQEFFLAEREESAEFEAAAQAGPVDLARRRAIFSRLTDLLTASTHIEDLAIELRSEGRAAEARALADQALATLRTAPLGSFAILDEWNSSRLEILRGDTFMDENRPREAEQAFLAAVSRLEKIEQEIESRRAAAAGDAEAERQVEGQLAMVRDRRAGALLSLAVNANVRARDPAKALGYFERAYVLDQSPSMEVLRACYRARSGRADEARTVLRKVVPTAQLYYNIACTHALLGEKGPALDFLERDFRENYPTPGARARQTEWARQDPDLASLRGEPRFERLLAGGQ